MSETVLVALIGSAQVVTVTLLGILAAQLGKVRRDSTATREQVVNHHTTNFRDENDSRHRETRGWFNDLRRDVGGLRKDIRQLRDDDHELAVRITHIEQKGNHDHSTHPRRGTRDTDT